MTRSALREHTCSIRSSITSHRPPCLQLVRSLTDQTQQPLETRAPLLQIEPELHHPQQCILYEEMHLYQSSMQITNLVALELQ